jgi:hypothetical protein
MKVVKRIVIGGIVIVVAFIMLVACVGGSSTPTPESVDDRPPTVAVDSDEPTAFGESWNDDGLVLTVSQPTETAAFGMSGYCFKVAYANGTDEPVSFNTFDWKMTNSDGVVLTPTFIGADPNESLGSGDLAPNGKRAGTVCYEDKGSATPVALTYAPIMDGGHDWK